MGTNFVDFYGSPKSLLVGGEQRLLEDAVEDAAAVGDEVEGTGTGVAAKQSAEVLEILAGEEAGRGDIGDDAVASCVTEGGIGEEAVKVGVTEQASAEAGASIGGEADTTVGRIPDNQVEAVSGRVALEGVGDGDRCRKLSAGGCGERQNCSVEGDLGQPGSEGIDLVAAESSGQGEDDVGR